MTYTETLSQTLPVESVYKDEDPKRLVSMVSSSGYFVYVETLDSDTNEWEQDDTYTQWQLWESDTADYMKARDLATDKDCLEFFEYQGLYLPESGE
jgi:hypothetical protein